MMKFKQWFIVSMLFLILLVAITPASYLVVMSGDDTLLMLNLAQEPYFSLRWVHSVEKEEWEEYFVLKQNSIYLYETRFKTFGAGVPSQVGTNSYLRDGWVYMTGIDREIGELFIRAGSITNHRLYWDHQVFHLSKVNQETPYHLNVERLPRLQYYTFQLFNKLKR